MLPKRLTGWQRLWVVFAVLTFAITISFVYLAQQSTTLVEDANILEGLNSEDVTKIEIPGIGDVAFPSDMPKTEIETLIRENYARKATAIPELARQKVREQNIRGAESNKARNDQARKANRNIIFYGYSVWLALIILIYIFGWAFGWVYRGFKTT